MAHLINPRTASATSLRAVTAEPGWEERPVHAGATHLDGGVLPTWVQALVDDAREGSPRPEGCVPSTHRWWVHDDLHLARCGSGSAGAPGHPTGRAVVERGDHARVTDGVLAPRGVLPGTPSSARAAPASPGVPVERGVTFSAPRR